MNTIAAIQSLVLSFKGREMTHDQNLAIFNLIEAVFGGDAADVFSKYMDSSDEHHDRTTTYTYLDNVQTVWEAILKAGLDQ